MGLFELQLITNERKTTIQFIDLQEQKLQPEKQKCFELQLPNHGISAQSRRRKLEELFKSKTCSQFIS